MPYQRMVCPPFCAACFLAQSSGERSSEPSGWRLSLSGPVRRCRTLGLRPFYVRARIWLGQASRSASDRGRRTPETHRCAGAPSSIAARFSHADLLNREITVFARLRQSADVRAEITFGRDCAGLLSADWRARIAASAASVGAAARVLGWFSAEPGQRFRRYLVGRQWLRAGVALLSAGPAPTAALRRAPSRPRSAYRLCRPESQQEASPS